MYEFALQLKGLKERGLGFPKVQLFLLLEICCTCCAILDYCFSFHMGDLDGKC